ncbi:MAG: hypothetical protein Q9225_003178 [Loekoesia sp. 1 TL-2023]
MAKSVESRDASTPKPIVIPASQNFEGNDGPWSTFTVQLGNPAQDVNVFISTVGYQIWAVAPEGCTASDGANCAKLRGGVYNRNQSTTWIPNDISPNTSSPNKTDGFTLGLEENLGYNGVGIYGFDNVTLGWQGSGGPSLDHQIVASIATIEFYFGIFGLNPKPTNFSTFADPTPSYLSNLKSQNMIPSLSWGYTAGNQYRLNKVLGSLTLGGYDASRFIPNSLTIPFNQQDVRDLTVNVNAISAAFENGSQRSDLLQSRIAAFVDSTIPYIYLPAEACKKFEDAFGIVWNEKVQAYLVNDTLHDSLVTQNASVIFTISNSTSGSGTSVDITLPYAAFDLVAEYPLVRNTTRYFPLMRAANESQYTLGRTFLQEAYLIADYERRNFSISQCSWVENPQQDIKSISAPANGTDSRVSQHLASGRVAGIVVGSIVVISAVGLAFYFSVVRKWRTKRKRNEEEKSDGSGSPTELDVEEKPLEIDGERHLGPEIDGYPPRGPELDGNPFTGQEIDGNPHPGSEMEASNAFAQELGTKQVAATEMATNGVAATELVA